MVHRVAMLASVSGRAGISAYPVSRVTGASARAGNACAMRFAMRRAGMVPATKKWLRTPAWRLEMVGEAQDRVDAAVEGVIEVRDKPAEAAEGQRARVERVCRIWLSATSFSEKSIHTAALVACLRVTRPHVLAQQTRAQRSSDAGPPAPPPQLPGTLHSVSGAS